MKRKRYDNERLNHLISECITFNLRPPEALEYIRISFGPIQERSYFLRKARLKGEGASNLWLSHFTKIGFVQEHHELMRNIKHVQEDRLRQFKIETSRNAEDRDERKISLINYDIRENMKLITDLMQGTPIISSIKASVIKREQAQNVGTIQTGITGTIPPVE